MQAQNEHQEAQPKERHIDFDQDGFLLDPHSWNKQMARTIAELDEIGPLGPDHWSVIYYLREHHLTYGSLPWVPKIRTH